MAAIPEKIDAEQDGNEASKKACLNRMQNLVMQFPLSETAKAEILRDLAGELDGTGQNSDKSPRKAFEGRKSEGSTYHARKQFIHRDRRRRGVTIKTIEWDQQIEREMIVRGWDGADDFMLSQMLHDAIRDYLGYPVTR